MRVNKIAIPHVINPEYNMVVLKIEKPFEDFLTHITIAQYDGWKMRKLNEKYTIHIMEKNIVKFEYLTLLIETDHEELLSVIQDMLQVFVAYSLEYPIIYEEQVEVLKADLDSIDGCFLNNTIKGTICNTFTFYFTHDSEERQEIQHRLNRLQQDFKQEVLIYPIKDELKSRISLRSQDVPYFLAHIVKHYFADINEMIKNNLERIGMKASILIEKMDYFIKKDGPRGNYYDAGGFTGNYGLVFTIYGYQEAYCKIYKFLQKWFDGLHTVIVEVQTIECCKLSKLEEYFENSYSKSHAILLQPLPQTKTKGQQRVLVFEPTISKADLQHFFKTTKRIISGLQFKDLNFEQLARNWNEFIDFSQLNIRAWAFDDFVLAECTKGEEKWLRQRIQQFLQNYNIEQTPIQQFSNKFYLSLFQKIYRQEFHIKNKNVEFYILNEVLHRKNFVKDTENTCKQLREIYQRMRKRIVWKPITKPLPQRVPYFKESIAKEWENTECLQSMQLKLQGKITINVRSFASIASKEQECIFIIEKLSDCTELKKILADEGSINVEKRLTDNPVLGISLRFSSFFDNITTCLVVLPNSRERVWTRRLQQTIQSLISNHKDSKHIRFMFHRNSSESVKVLMPIIINSLKAISSLGSESKIKEVTLFTSLEGGAALRKEITQSLRDLRAKIKIDLVAHLNLKVHDLQKIVTYGYFSLKYFDKDQTMEASPLRSFIFGHQQKKKKQTPIFLPEGDFPCEYLINRFNDTTYRVAKYRVRELSSKLPQLQAMKEVLRQYFPPADYFVVPGNEQGTDFCRRLFFTSQEQRHYKNLERVDLDLASKKITLTKAYLRYELISNEFLEVRRVETHSHMVEQLMKIMEQNSPS